MLTRDYGAMIASSHLMLIALLVDPTAAQHGEITLSWRPPSDMPEIVETRRWLGSRFGRGAVGGLANASVPRGRCKRYGWDRLATSTRRLFAGGLLVPEKPIVFHLVAAEMANLVEHLVLMETNASESGVPIAWHFTDEKRNDGPELISLFAANGVKATIHRYHEPMPGKYSATLVKMRALARIPKVWASQGMKPEDVGIVQDTDESFTREYLAAMRDCDVPSFRPRLSFTKPKLVAKSFAFEGAFDCVLASRAHSAYWFHPDAVPGRCIEGISQRSSGVSANFWDASGNIDVGDGNFARWSADLTKDPERLWTGADIRMREGPAIHVSAWVAQPFTAVRFRDMGITEADLRRRYSPPATDPDNSTPLAELHADAAVLASCMTGEASIDRAEEFYVNSDAWAASLSHGRMPSGRKSGIPTPALLKRAGASAVNVYKAHFMKPNKAYYVFASMCGLNADVSSEVMVHSFWRSGTKGMLRRLDTCATKWKYPHVWLPTYKIESFPPAGEGLKAMLLTKPWLLTQWLKTNPHADRVVILDLDMVIISPLHELMFGPSSPHGLQSGMRGKPVGAKYLLGEPVTITQGCRRLRNGHDCDAPMHVAANYYHVGPPQALHIDDLRDLLPVWYNDTVRRIDQKAAWAVDMPAYVVAAASIGLRHGMSTELYVSNPQVACEDEGWRAVRLGTGTNPLHCTLADGTPVEVERWSKLKPPSVHPLIHFCQFYTTQFDVTERVSEPNGGGRKLPGRFFGKFEFSASHGGVWGKLDPFVCGAAPQHIQSDETYLSGLVQSPAVSRLEQVRRRHAYMILELRKRHNDAFANYWSRCCLAHKSGALLSHTIASKSEHISYGVGGKRLQVAFAITALDFSAELDKRTVSKADLYFDGAAVLAHSVALTQNRTRLAVDMIALVVATATTASSRLSSLGYRVIASSVPVQRHEIRRKYLRDTIETAGCCGSMELIKLRAYQLVEYDRVLVLDMDSIVLHSLEDLFMRSVNEGRSLMYTEDPSLSGPGAAAHPVNGGFLLITPSVKVYDELVEIVREGDFREGSGWGGANIGWVWGGRTVQGLLAYYYNRVAPPNASVKLDICRYNAMHEKHKGGADCTAVPFDEVQTAHFTDCQKPWTCIRRHNHLCPAMTTAWWKVHASLGAINGLPYSPPCEGSYKSFPHSLVAWNRNAIQPVSHSAYMETLRLMRFWKPDSKPLPPIGLI